ncbi:phage tail tape measure protein (plasmid) [Paenibacillus peoriae]|uniref:Phage tail tape measure protein n=1 Tax=Paenibacillus peoriae TaxID=59893 RepID=A0A7H0YH66_9BACL|nr:phage tail tape measure protein [Paenibacillus peoriae]QNR70424.1 phage tail tape measure protein [Paenibacillus peoriae]
MAENLPALGADVVLEFQQSIKNIQMFGEAMAGLDTRFGGIERRVDSLRSSLSSLSSQVSRGAGKNLRAEMQRELDNLVTSNGIVLSKVGTMPLKVNQETVRGLFTKAEKLINLKLAEMYRNVSIDINPNMSTGKVLLGDDQFKEVNRAIGRLVRTQLNNIVKAIQKQGASLISPEDIQNLRMNIGKGTAQQIIQKVKQELVKVLLNPTVNASDLKLTFSAKDLNQLTSKINAKIKTTLDQAIASVNGAKGTADFAPNLKRIYNEIDLSVSSYISKINTGLGKVSGATLATPFEKLSKQVKQQISRELGKDINQVSRELKGLKLDSAEVSGIELRRQFSRLEQSLNKKLQGGVQTQIKDLIAHVQAVELKPDGRLKHHLTNQISRINNAIVKKIREQIDLQFSTLRAEVNSINASSDKSLNRSARIRQMNRLVNGSQGSNERVPSSTPSRTAPVGPDPYARRDDYYSGFGLQGAMINTFRHILAGSLVGAPMMLLYNAFEDFRTSQLEQLKIGSNLMFKDDYKIVDENGQKTNSIDFQKVNTAIQGDIVPFTQNASSFYAIDYGQMSQVASISSRLNETPDQIKKFIDLVGQTYNIDREADPVHSIAPGLEAVMGQFGLTVGELEEKVVKPMTVATNLTKATTSEVFAALMRSGSSFKTAGVTPEQAIAMTAMSVQQTGLSGENIGNFYKSILPRLQSDSSLKQLDSMGIKVYDKVDGVQKAKGGADILQQVSVQMGGMNDARKRDVIQALFGVYQSGKGQATMINDFEKFEEIMKGISGFNQEDFSKLMANNLQSNIVNMDRAGTSLNLAVVSVLEELGPELNTLARSVANFGEGIRENASLFADLARALGSALIGFAAWQGLRKVTQASGYQSKVDAYKTRDSIMGYNSKVKSWQREGVMTRLNGAVGFSPDLTKNTVGNRQMLNAMLLGSGKNTLGPYLKDMAAMSPGQVDNMKKYVEANKLQVANFKDMIMVSQESKRWSPPEKLTDEQRHGRSQYAVNQLSKNKGLMGGAIDKDFFAGFAQNLRDKNSFDNLGKTDKGKSLISFFAGMDEKGMAGFQSYVDQQHRETGKKITDVNSLHAASEGYQDHKRQKIKADRTAIKDFADISNAFDDLDKRLNGSKLDRGMNRFNSFLGGIPAMARGAGAALGGLLSTIGKFGAQMALFYALGEIISGLTYATSTTGQQKQYDESKKQYEDTTAKSREYILNGGTWDGFLQDVGFGVSQLLDAFMPGDQKTSTVDMQQAMGEILKTLEENHDVVLDSDGMKVTGWSGDANVQLKDWLNSDEAKKKGITLDSLLQETVQRGGDESILKKYEVDKAKNFKIEYEKNLQGSIDENKLKEEADAAAKKRIANDLREGSFDKYDKGTIQDVIDDKLTKFNTTQKADQIKGLLDGMTTDSDKYIAMRKKQNQELADVYTEQIKLMDDNIKALQDSIKLRRMMKEAPDEEEAAELDRAKSLRNEYGVELEQKRDEQLHQGQAEVFRLQMSQFDKGLSRVQANATTRDLKNSLDGGMDRNTAAFVDKQIDSSQQTVSDMQAQLNKLKSMKVEGDFDNELMDKIKELENAIAQEQVNIRELRLARVTAYRQVMTDQVEIYNKNISSLQKELSTTDDVEGQNTINREIMDLQNKKYQAQLNQIALRLSDIGLYKEDMNISLDKMDVDYLKKKVDTGITDESNPILKNFRIGQYNEQVSLFSGEIAKLQAKLPNAQSEEEAKAIQQEIRDLQKQQYQAQLGILDEMKNTGGTFNLPDGVKAMTYYEYMTRNNTQSTYTVQQGETNVTISLPNVNDGTSADKLKTIGKSIGEGISQGRALRPQMLQNPYGYRTV